VDEVRQRLNGSPLSQSGQMEMLIPPLCSELVDWVEIDMPRLSSEFLPTFPDLARALLHVTKYTRNSLLLPHEV